MTVDLQNPDWRDANLETLPDWHPCLKDFATDVDTLANSFEDFATRYRDYLLTSSGDPQADLYCHVTDEVTIHLYRRFESILAKLWDDHAEGVTQPSMDVVTDSCPKD